MLLNDPVFENAEEDLSMFMKAMYAVAALTAVGFLVGCDKQKAVGVNSESKYSASQTDWDPSDAKKLAQGEKIKIGFIVKQAEEPWFQDEWKYAQEAGKKYGFEVVKLEGADGEKVLSKIDALASQGAQGFVICTPDVKLGPSIVARAKQHKLKVMSVDDQFVDAEGKFMNIHHMGIDAPNIGKAMGEGLYKLMKERKWDVKEVGVFIPTFRELDTARERTDGAKKALLDAGFPESQIYEVAQKSSDVEGGLNAANVAFAQHGDVKKWLICGMNDEAVLGAVRAFEQHQFNADTMIGVGIGGRKSAADEFAKANPTGFAGTILISPRKHGFDTTEIMYKWIKSGVEPERKPIFTQGFFVTRDGYKAKLKELGLTE
jgi:L-arabinose transport system substrate-binding protein